jgi:hypothetical protein
MFILVMNEWCVIGTGFISATGFQTAGINLLNQVPTILREKNWEGHGQMAGERYGADTIIKSGPVRLPDFELLKGIILK